MKRNFILSLTLLLMLIVVQDTPAEVKAPSITLFSSKGKLVLSSKLRNKNLIVSFWASYCVPCRKEMPELVKFEKKYAGSKNLKLLLISVDKDDSSGSAKAKGFQTLKEIGLNHEFLLDIYQLTIKKYTPQIKVPATFLVNKKGVIVFKEIGAKKDTLQKLEKAIKKLK
ncbi:MAG: TlpA family protein disulfide reductase [bacterium]|nr:TlpA family protein disulfide reductase [bacterium]